MKLPTRMLVRAAVKRKRAEGPSGPSTRPRVQAPSQSTTALSSPPRELAPSPPAPPIEPAPPSPPALADFASPSSPAWIDPREHAVAPEIDLTADTPPETVRVEGATSQEIPPLVIQPSPKAGPSTAPAHPEPSPITREDFRAAAPAPPSLGDGRLAEELVAPILLPEFRDELLQLGTSAFFRQAYAAISRLASSLAVAREVMHEGQGDIKIARREAERAWEEEGRARQEAVEARQEAERALARAEGAEAALGEAKAERAEELRSALHRAEVEATRARMAIGQMCEAKSTVEARDVHIADLTAALRKAEAKAEQA